MPKVTWMKPKVNYLAALFSAYRKATGKTSTQIADEIGTTPSNARTQMSKPGKEWNIGQLLRYCDALGIPYDEAFAAATKESAAPEVPVRKAARKLSYGHCTTNAVQGQERNRK